MGAGDFSHSQQDNEELLVLPANIDNAIREFLSFDQLFKSFEAFAVFYRAVGDKPLPLIVSGRGGEGRGGEGRGGEGRGGEGRGGEGRGGEGRGGEVIEDNILLSTKIR